MSSSLLRGFKILSLFSFLWCGGTAFALSIQENKDYKVLSAGLQPKSPSDKKIEVLEFFSYVCIHCYNLEPQLQLWKQKLNQSPKYKDVMFRREHVSFGQQTAPWVRLYRSIQSVPQGEQIHAQIFRTIMDEKKDLSDPVKLKAWLAGSQFKDQEAKIMQQLNNVSAQSLALKASNDLTRLYGIDSTPAIIVDGKYRLEPAEPARLLAVLDELINKVREERKLTRTTK